MAKNQRTWTLGEIEFINANYLLLTPHEIACELNRSQRSVEHKMLSLNLRRPVNIWTDEDIKFLTDNYNTMTAKQIAERIGRTVNTVWERAKILGLKKTNRDANKVLSSVQKHRVNKRAWTDDEIQFVMENYGTMEAKEIAEVLSRTQDSVKRKADYIGIKKSEYHAPWTDEELTFLYECYPKLNIVDLLRGLQRRSIEAIYNKAYELGIKRETLQLSNTKPEIMFKDLLDKHNISYNQQVRIGERYYKVDFVVDNVVIEINGDFWHCNPEIYLEPMCRIQEDMIIKDIEKYDYLRSKGYTVLIIWESELYNNQETCFDKLLSILPS